MSALCSPPLCVERLSLRLRGFALDRVSFSVRPGEIAGFVGANGAGKSTTLKLVMGMLRKDAGTVTLGSLDHALHEKAFKQRIGFVDEESHFYPAMRVGEHLAFAASLYATWDDALARSLLRELALSPNLRAGQLSKGMRTKLALVVALAHHPQALLLDEPSDGLDPHGRLRLFELLRDARARGAAVLFSTHHLHEVERLADRVVVLHAGRVRAEVSLDELRARKADDQDPLAAGALERFFLRVAQSEARPS